MRKLLQSYPLLISLIIFVTISDQAFGQDCSIFGNKYRQSIISLKVERENKTTGAVTTGWGTGFIVSPEGFVLTAYHVVAQKVDIEKLEVRGSVASRHAPESKMRVVATDESSDIALLKFLDDSRLYSPVQIGCPWKINAGAELCSLNFMARDIAPNEDFQVTSGTLRSRTGESNRWSTQMPSNPGESGAPVLDSAKGTVIAMKYGGKDPGRIQNVNSLTPINLVETILKTYVGISIPSPPCDLSISNDSRKLQLEKVQGEQETIPLGGWKNFSVKVVNESGQPVAGIKIAWQTPIGGSLTYVSETDQKGISSATNLYTFSHASTYIQIATIVDKTTPVGFTNFGKLSLIGPSVTFVYYQR